MFFEGPVPTGRRCGTIYPPCPKGLRELEDDGLITRKQFNEIPPHVEYSLTEMGRDLLPVFYAIMNWGFKYDKELYGDTTK